jgi:diguanylate cyclase (GGDEF)-like protein
LEPAGERESLTDWEEEARRREELDPRRRAHLQNRLNRVLAGQLPALLGVLALLYAGTSGWHWLRLDPGSDRLWLVGSSLVIALILGLGGIRFRSRRVESTHAHPILLGVLALAVADGVLHVRFSGDPIHSTGFMLLLVACGAFFMDFRWLRGAIALVLLAWGGSLVAFAWGAPTGPHFAIGMILALVLSGLIATFRIRNMRRLESLNMELQGLIGLDGLTGIANRRAFESRMEGLWERLREDRQPLALILCDLDYFKNLNDTRGHGEGDAALRQVGGILRLAVRSTDDLPARLGGEEFGILLPRTTRDQALLVAERIREATAFTRIPNPGAPTGETLTMSLGLAVAWPSSHLSPATLLDRADAALYQAKESGRNRVVVEEGRTVPEPASMGPLAGAGERRGRPEKRFIDGVGQDDRDPPHESPPDTSPAESNPLDRTLSWPSEDVEPRHLPRPTDDPFWVPPSSSGRREG